MFGVRSPHLWWWGVGEEGDRSPSGCVTWLKYVGTGIWQGGWGATSIQEWWWMGQVSVSPNPRRTTAIPITVLCSVHSSILWWSGMKLAVTRRVPHRAAVFMSSYAVCMVWPMSDSPGPLGVRWMICGLGGGSRRRVDVVQGRRGTPYHPRLYNGLLRRSVLGNNSTLSLMMVCCYDNCGLAGALRGICL